MFIYIYYNINNTIYDEKYKKYYSIIVKFATNVKSNNFAE